ncbi:MAG: hypothetical protein NTX25_01405 [Proteobacteria bacterium]|nr:hypothetical protein [Pseudomonadota bacterium]
MPILLLNIKGNSKMGRPKKPDDKKKVKLTISLSRELKEIAMATGDASLFFMEAGFAKAKKEEKLSKVKVKT